MDIEIIDSHAHLDFDRFEADFNGVLERARQAGVVQIVTIGASHEFDSNLRALEIARAHRQVFCTLGIHPHDASMVREAHLDQIRGLTLAESKVVAIGEIGLDYHYERSPRDVQVRVFRDFLRLAHELDKPVVIHTREAEEETLAVLEEEEVHSGVLHCFSGSPHLAERALELGLYVSLSGIVTFKNAEDVKRVARDLPDDRIMVETDAPYLAPVPRRGKRNEPAYVRHTLEFVAELRGLPPHELAALTTANTRRLFGLPSVST